MLKGWQWRPLLAMVLVGVAAIATGLGFLGRLDWRLGLLEHGRLQFFGLGLIGLGLSWGVKRRAGAMPLLVNRFGLGLALLTLGVNGAVLLPVAMPGSSEAIADDAPYLTLQHLNIDRHHRDRDRIIDYLNRQTADLIWLQEVTPDSLADFNQRLMTYRVVAAMPQNNSQGTALLQRQQLRPSASLGGSALPIDVVETTIHALPKQSQRPLMSVVIRWQDLELTVLSLHVTRPRNAQTTAFQRRELDAIADWVNAEQSPNHPMVVLGDFNSTPWSGLAHQFQWRSGLYLARRGWGIYPTWPAQWPFFFQIPIDYCLHSRSLHTRNYRVGAVVGSDHRPIEVQVQLAR